jgi:hypothetical protein
MNDYEAKQEARRQRYLELAEKAAKKSESAYGSAHRIADVIPPGQPILVGHHSEKRHRRDLERIDNKMRQSVEESKKAEYYKSKALSVGDGGISSDDPEAVQKLQEKLAKCEVFQEKSKATNKIVRRNPKNVATPEKIADLIALGMKESTALKAFEPDFCGRIGIPAYALQNNNAEIRRLKKRIEELQAKSTKESYTIDFVGGTALVNYEENRVQIFHDEKPPLNVRQELKRRGFNWSRQGVCWQRKITNNALYQLDEFIRSTNA